MKLTLKDRVVIANQLRILEKLYPEDAGRYSEQRIAIEEGYALHYADIAEHLYEELSEDACREVLDILNMYRAIAFSGKQIEDSEKLAELDLEFPGFDGNNEPRQHSYTAYFIVELGRFDELRGEGGYPDFNSHMEMLPKYRRMLSVWSRFADKFHLTQEQIAQLLEA